MPADARVSLRIFARTPRMEKGPPHIPDKSIIFHCELLFPIMFCGIIAWKPQGRFHAIAQSPPFRIMETGAHNGQNVRFSDSERPPYHSYISTRRGADIPDLP